MEPVNERDVESEEQDGVEGSFRQKRLAEAAGSEQLGCSLYELPPGCQPFSYHYHAANEEALFVLAGSGTLHLDGEEYSIEAGDYVPCPADESGGHAVVNDSDEPLRMLAVSTMREPDVTIHPEIDKLGVYVGSPPGRPRDRTLSGFYDVDAAETGEEDG